MASFFELTLDTTAPALSIANVPNSVEYGTTIDCSLLFDSVLSDVNVGVWYNGDTYPLDLNVDGETIEFELNTNVFVYNAAAFMQAIGIVYEATDLYGNSTGSNIYPEMEPIPLTYDIPTEPLTELELYGATYGMDDETYNNLVDGFDTVRQSSGWGNFKIPEFTWTYVNQTERDEIISALKTVIYEEHSSSEFDNYGTSQNANFAIAYTMSVFTRAWNKLPDNNNKESMVESTMQMAISLGMPTSSFEEGGGAPAQ